MKLLSFKTFALGALCAASTLANAASYTFNDATLGQGTSFSQGGFTMNASATDGGVLGNIGSGQYAGLWVGENLTAAGSYHLSFSENVSSISIQFDALSSTGGTPVETISHFATSNGAVLVNYTNLDGTTFSNNTVYSETNDGRGLITFSGPAFAQFSFDHMQAPSQNGFVIESITVNTSPVPEPEGYAMMALGLLALGAVRRFKK